MSIVFLSIGSNLGDRAANMRAAIGRLNDKDTRVEAVSRFYESAPVGETPEPVPDYLNCAAQVETDLSPEALLNRTQQVERDLGRVPTYRWGPRVIDIDILLYDQVTLESERLTLPHPRLKERAFVVIPLNDIAPNLKLPDSTWLWELVIDPVIRGQVLHPLRNT